MRELKYRMLSIGARFKLTGNPYVYTKIAQVPTARGTHVVNAISDSGQFCFVLDSEKVTIVK